MKCQSRLELASDLATSDLDLLHLLTCNLCRRVAIERLLAEPGDEDETLEYELVFQKLAAESEEVMRRLMGRRAEAERLAESLLSAPRGSRLRKLKNPRYQSSDLLEYLLEQSHSLQLADPGRSLELASLAYRVALRLGDAEAEAALPRSVCLEINARRLLGVDRGQEGALSRAAKLLREVTDRALFCRTAALIRWEQGRTDEASALLQQAARLYRTEELTDEVCTCTALLGLLYSEEGFLSEALPLLYQGWASMDRELRPLLAQRAGLALVVCLGEAGQKDKASAVLEETWRLYEAATPPEAMLRVYWREALALAAVERFDEAEHLLRSVLHRMIEEEDFPEVVLVALHLFGLLLETGRAGEIEQVASDLGPEMAEQSAFSQVVKVINRWTDLYAGEDSAADLRGHLRFLSADLIRWFRWNGYWIQPLPFA